MDLDASIGSLHRPVTTESATAQKFYDQGISFLASFHWIRAARSFHQCLRRDPGVAVAHVGLARAYLGLGARAEALSAAQVAMDLSRRRRLTDAERAWIRLGLGQMEAVAALEGGSFEEHTAYLAAIERQSERFPNDPGFLVLRGNADRRPDGWGQSASPSSIPWYERALDIDPEHFPAHHFLAHALEQLGRYRSALDHAYRFAELAPGAPHAHHMVAHIAPRLGDWEEALDRLLTADRLHRRDFASGSTVPSEDWHFGHNLRLLAAAHLHLGHEDRAEALLRETYEQEYAGRRSAFYCSPWIEFLLARGRFVRVLEAANACSQRESHLARLLGNVYRGEALLALNRPKEAHAALSKAKAQQRRFLSSLGAAPNGGVFAFHAAMAVSVLEGKALLRTPDSRAGETLIRQAASALAARPTADSWALGWLRLKELAADALRVGHEDLASELRQRAANLTSDLELDPTRASNSHGSAER